MANWRYFSKAHKVIYRLTNGFVGSRLEGVDMALISITGRKSGQVRTTPIACYPYKDSIAVSASNNGLDKNPLWYLNLKATPEATIQFRNSHYNAIAIELMGEDREELWQTVIKLNPKQAEHEGKTERSIPLIWFKRL
ncbi:MAG: nitroreductase/quinone reductase family protein [Halioglobus sp.]